MTETTLANIAARAAFSGREESEVTSEPLPMTETVQDEARQGNKIGKVLQQLLINIKLQIHGETRIRETRMPPVYRLHRRLRTWYKLPGTHCF